MSFTRSALFACAVVTAGSACKQRTVNPEPDRIESRRIEHEAAPPAAQTTTTPQTYEATVPPAPGTSAPNGGGALGGAAIATQPAPEPPVAAAPEQPAVTHDRQGRSITVRRRSSPPSLTTPSTTTPSTMPQDTTTRPTDDTAPPSDDTLSPNPEPGTSDTSGQSTRANPDSQNQGIGGGDTYDRNR